MDKDEFLGILRSQLSGQMPEQQIVTHIQYYRSYIEERIAAGSSESEVMRELGDPRLIARTLLDTENGGNTSQNSGFAGESGYGNPAGSDTKEHKFKLDLTTWYGKLIVVLIAAVILILLFILLGILIPIMVVAGAIIYLVRFRRK